MRGKGEIRPFFEAGFRKRGSELSRWYRTDQFFPNGRQLTWEYPRETPRGDQVDLVEVMDVVDGLIAISGSIGDGSASGLSLPPRTSLAELQCRFV